MFQDFPLAISIRSKKLNLKNFKFQFLNFKFMVKILDDGWGGVIESLRGRGVSDEHKTTSLYSKALP